MKFNSRFEYLPGVISHYDQPAIKVEPMLWNCDLPAALENGGRITREFIHALPEEWLESPLVIDSRVHMLMSGWFPCIPGWHHDDVPRTRSDGQPNYGPGQDRSEHILLLVNGDICPTEFAVGEAEFTEPHLGKTLYAEWDPQVNLLVANGVLKSEVAQSNRLIKFDDRTWHRGVPAVDGGWRFFIRASRYFDSAGNPIARRNARANEVRTQVQVYLPVVNAGW